METHWDHETVKVSDVKSLIAKAHATLCVVIHALDTKILVGEINRPEALATKIKRKRRTKGEMEARKHTPSMRNPPELKMDLEKEYQADRHEPLNLPDADKGNTFYTTPNLTILKKERKKREKKIDGGE